MDCFELKSSATERLVVSRVRVLLAEDDTDVRQALAVALRLDGCDVTEARDGDELLQFLGMPALCASFFEPPDVVISDLRMPGCSGLDVVEGLRRSDWDMPYILITAYADERLRAVARELEVAEVLNKPIDPDDLCSAVRRVVFFP